MSQNTKVAVGIVVVLGILGAGYYWYQHMNAGTGSGNIFSNASTTLPSGSNSSDQSLQQDTAAIDAQMKGLSADQATVNTSVNDSAQTQ